MKLVFVLTLFHAWAVFGQQLLQDRVLIRPYGHRHRTPKSDKTFGAVLGYNVTPNNHRNRLRVIQRSPNEETLAAAEAAGLKAKELQRKAKDDGQVYKDMDSFESSLVPVSSQEESTISALTKVIKLLRELEQVY